MIESGQLLSGRPRLVYGPSRLMARRRGPPPQKKKKRRRRNCCGGTMLSLPTFEGGCPPAPCYDITTSLYIYTFILRKHEIIFSMDSLLFSCAPGFTFSFPMVQTGLKKGILVTWTKSFACPDGVGEDAVQMLEEALSRRGVRDFSMQVLRASHNLH